MHLQKGYPMIRTRKQQIISVDGMKVSGLKVSSPIRLLATLASCVSLAILLVSPNTYAAEEDETPVILNDTSAPDLPLDSDNDGILDEIEGNSDTDGDGISDSFDTDSDNDGIPDALEANVVFGLPVDTDGDGIPDYLDLDSDNDGLLDTVERTSDFDADGVADYLDLDSDNDGLPDTWESAGASVDTDADGIIDNLTDLNGDGVSDSTVINNIDDTDGDGLANQLDLDSDGDGVPDIIEAGGNDLNADGIVDQWTDSDADGLFDSIDVDSTGGQDRDGDGIDDSADSDFVILTDTDGDGVIDAFDNDVLGDGFIPIVVEGSEVLIAGLPDIDGDNVPDVLQVNSEQQTETVSEVEQPTIGAAQVAAAMPLGAITSGTRGVGCSIAAVEGKGPMDSLLALTLLFSVLGLGSRRKARCVKAKNCTRFRFGLLAHKKTTNMN